jgi:hypothetical protein
MCKYYFVKHVYQQASPSGREVWGEGLIRLGAGIVGSNPD